MDGSDTETLIAMVSSLLDGSPPDGSVILEALVSCDGDVAAAAKALNTRRLDTPSKVAGSKRKRKANIEDWLKASPRQGAATDEASSSTPSRTRTSAKPASKDKPISSSSLRVKPVSTSKATVDLMSVLKQPKPASADSRKTAARLPPLMLYTPEKVAEHTPCTMHLNVLPQELACRLFYTMMGLSVDWKPNKWWLFDRVVESPHVTSFFARKDIGDASKLYEVAAMSWYNGRKRDPPATFPEPMEEACRIVEKVVNDELAKRKRYPLEWGGDAGWKANVAASNRYAGGKDGVGWHSDQLNNLGPYPTIASLSLGVRRTFGLREVIPSDEKKTRQPRTFYISLPHNSLTIMHASCQERFRHSIPQQSSIDIYKPAFPPESGEKIQEYNSRINITFRFYRPDFACDRNPVCKCGLPMILRPDMKNRVDDKVNKYWWTCYAGAQNDGKGCDLWQVMDMEKEGRGPLVGDLSRAK